MGNHRGKEKVKEKVHKLISDLYQDVDMEYEEFFHDFGEYLCNRGYSLFEISDIITNLFDRMQKQGVA